MKNDKKKCRIIIFSQFPQIEQLKVNLIVCIQNSKRFIMNTRFAGKKNTRFITNIIKSPKSHSIM